MTLDTFFEKFDLFADAPDAVAKMRELILGLAVQGRLVPQDPSDEPATELVIRVALVKLHLVQKKEIKAESPTVPISGDEALFEIPSSWTWVRAGDLCRPISSGSTPDQSVFHSSEGIPYLKVYNIRSQFVDFEYKRQFIDVSHHEERMKRSRLLPGDVIMNIVGPPLGKVAIVPDEYPEWNCNQAIAFFRPIFPEFAPYLYTFLKQGSFLQNIQLIGTAGQDNISVTKCKFIPIPIPPLAEQKRIVAKVDELMALCDRLALQQQEREEQASKLARASLARFADAPTPANLDYLFHSSFNIPPSDLRKSILTLAVQGKLVPQDPTDEDALALLGQIAAHKTALAKDGKLRGSTTVKPMADDEAEFELPANWSWVRFGEIMVNRDGERIPVSKEERETKAKIYDYYGASGVIDKIDGYLFNKPLLLIGEDGANLINRSTPIAFIARGKYWVNNHAHVLDGITEDFLQFIELHINAINLEKYVTGSAQPKMNQAKMNSIPIPLPPLAEQRRIVAKVEQLMALVDALETQLAASRATAGKLMEAAVAELTKIT
jgi:type I restriction enzyme S subunit